MVYAEYGLLESAKRGLVLERPGKKWSLRKTRNAITVAILEEEIRMLRSLMEEAYREHQSFTADLVIDISRALDDKINEYMKLTQNKSRP